jgi:hypothetical protein
MYSAILGPVRRVLVLAAVMAALVAGCDSHRAKPPPGAAPPAGATATRTDPPRANERLSPSPHKLAERVTFVSRRLRHSIDDWLATDPGPRAHPPIAVQLRALYQQRVVRRLAHRRRLASKTLPLLPSWLRGEMRTEVRALRELFRLSSPSNEHRFKTKQPVAPRRLLRFYRAGQRRFHVRWSVLAAVNMIESAFCRLTNDSSAGAQGPMQFIPSTWRRYGMGGDVHDPHGAILGAANYLHAAGAPSSYTRALYAYNNSPLYVDAVLRFARRMGADRRAYYALWSWQVFVRTKRGDVRLTYPR